MLDSSAQKAEHVNVANFFPQKVHLDGSSADLVFRRSDVDVERRTGRNMGRRRHTTDIDVSVLFATAKCTQTACIHWFGVPRCTRRMNFEFLLWNF